MPLHKLMHPADSPWYSVNGREKQKQYREREREGGRDVERDREKNEDGHMMVGEGILVGLRGNSIMCEY